MFKTSFDDILDLCLDRLEEGETVESCLNDYPANAAELKGPLELATRFSHLPLEKPSLAADFHFQQQLNEIVPVPTRDAQLNIGQRLIDFINRMREPIIEIGFMALTVALIALFFVSRANLADQGPAALLVAKESLTYADLANIEYDAVLVGSIKLDDGRYPLVTSDEKGTPHFIHLDRRIGTGDLDEDGWEDAAALLFWRDESAMPLWSLVIVRNDQGEPKNVASTFLGPNLKVDNLEIINGLIHISVSDEYGTVFSKIYQFEGSTLVLLEEFSELEQQSAQKEELLEQLGSDFEGQNNRILATNRLGSLSYPIEGRTVMFKEGIVYGEYFSTRVLDTQTTSGDLTDDGKTESLAALLTQSSSSESIYFLSVVTDGDAEAVPITSLTTENTATPIRSNELGDQLEIDSMQVIDGEIVIELKALEENDSICCSTMETTYKFELIENELVPLSAN